MSHKEEIENPLDFFSDKQKWAMAFICIVILDTFLTKFALQNSLGVEANMFIEPIVNEGKFTFLIFIKSMVIITTAVYTERHKEDRLTDRMIVNYTFIIGITIVLWNVVMILGSMYL